MRKNLAFFFLTCSLILVLGHSILPHSHVGENHYICRICDVKDSSLGDIIKLTLSHDLGAYHLEEYKNCNLLAITSSGSQGVFLKTVTKGFSIIAFSSTNENFVVTNSELTDEYLFLCTGLRAPPFRS